MQIAAVPLDEEQRLETLHKLELLDTAPEPGFDSLTAIAAQVFDVPTSLVSLVDAERQWFKSAVGLDASETSRDSSFCAHAVAQRAPLVVTDTHDDLRFADNPLVSGAPFIRFYAGAPIFDPTGNHPLGTLCLIDDAPRELSAADLTLLQELARQVEAQVALRCAMVEAQAANEAKRRFLANVGHELRTPLNGIIGIQQLLSITPLDEEQTEYVDLLETSADYLIWAVDSILETAMSGEDLLASTTIETFDLFAVLEDVVDMCRTSANFAEVDLVLRWQDGLAVSRLGDALRLRELVLKLVINAIAVTNAGTVTVAVTAAHDDAIHINVEDTGPGIAEDQLERIFEQFTQIDDGLNRVHEGLGLGLFHARRLAEAMNGSLTVSSEVGHGSSFRLILPLVPAAK